MVAPQSLAPTDPLVLGARRYLELDDEIDLILYRALQLLVARIALRSHGRGRKDPLCIQLKQRASQLVGRARHLQREQLDLVATLRQLRWEL